MQGSELTHTVALGTIPWLPRSAAKALAGKVVDVQISDRLRARFERPQRMSMVKWAQNYRDLGKNKGLWSRKKTPHVVGIMAALDKPQVEMVVVCKAPQTGGTETILNFIGSSIHQDPSDMMCIMPDDDNARMLCKDRILPMIEASAHLSKYLGGDDSDVSGKRLALTTMTIYLASANSPSQLSSRACRYVLFDEVDKYPPMASKVEADPISLGIARTTTFENVGRKMLMVSTPTTEAGSIWQRLLSCQLVFHYWAQCPHCRRFQPMLFKNIVWDGGRSADPNHIEAHNEARYCCTHCGVLWTNADRDEAAINGHWRADSGGQEKFRATDARAGELFGERLERALRRAKIKSVGFHVPAWVSTFSSMSASAGAFLRAPSGEAGVGWRDFANRFEGLPYIPVAQSRAEDSIVALQDEYDEADVPEWADVLLLGADTQDNGFWYELRAFQRGPLLRSHGVRRGFVDSLAALEEVALNTVYCKPSGVEVPLRAGLIDAMGHRTVEVYDWCRKVRIIQPLKGERKLDQLLAETKIEKIGGRAIPGGMVLHRIDTNHFKNLLAAKLQISVADPGAWTFSSGLDPSHARHYVAEDVDPKTGYWACPQGRANHLWDCSTYVLALAYILRLRLVAREGGPAKRIIRKPPQREARW